MQTSIQSAVAASVLALAPPLLSACSSTPPPATEQRAYVIVEDDYLAARRAAIAAGSPLLVNSTAHTCQNCRVMEVSIFSKPAVAEALAPFVEARIYSDSQDASARSANESTIEKVVKRAAVPVYVALNPETGEELGRWEGAAFEPDAFAQFLNEAAAAYR